MSICVNHPEKTSADYNVGSKSDIVDRKGYRMIRSIDIENFRCFEKLTLGDLTRVNVVTGSNASGKSALLEAIYLGANATAPAFQTVATFRGSVASIPLNPGPLAVSLALTTPQSLSTYFDSLFRVTKGREGLTESVNKIGIEFSDSDATTYRLDISYQTGGSEPLPVGRTPSGFGPQVPIVLDRVKTIAGVPPQSTKIIISINQLGQMQQTPAISFGPTTFIFAAQTDYSEQDNVGWFSKLKERNSAADTIAFVHAEFPFIEDIEVLAPAGINGLYGTLSDGTRRRISNISSGIYKIISFLLSISSTSRGVIIIDEIENGIYYDKYPSVWRILYEFAKKTESQLFISSHSAECLEALPSIIGNDIADFSLLRAERSNGTCLVRHISGASMKAALKRGGEIRGASIASTTEESN